MFDKKLRKSISVVNWSIYCDREGIVWSGSAGSVTYENKKDKWIRTTSAFDTISWACIVYNKNDKTYWLGSMYSVMHFDKKFHLIKAYTQEDGLPGFATSGLIIDNNNNIWLNTITDIAMLNTTTGKIITLSVKDGLEPQKFSWQTPVAKDINGGLYFAGDLGVTYIRPHNFKVSFPATDIYIKSLEINQHAFVKAKDINSLAAVNLQYFQKQPQYSNRDS